MNEDSRRDSGREMAGLVIILIGFGLLMSTMGIVPFGAIFARYWLPALFIGIGAFLLVRSHGRESRFIGLFFLGFGVLMLLNAMQIFPFSFSVRQLIVPGVLIFIGMRLLVRHSGAPELRYREHADRAKRDWDKGREASTDASDFIDATAVLGGFNRRCSSQQFRGGDVTAVMGGGKLDLRDAKIQGSEAVLDVFTLMGGMEILVPQDWVIEQRFTPIMGGYEDKTRHNGQAGAQRLAIKGVTIMGGVTVTN